MKAIDSFSTKVFSLNDGVKDNSLTVFFNKKTTSLVINGLKLKHQFQTDNFYLLITTSLADWGQVVYFHLIDKELNKIDELWISGDVWDSFFLGNLEVVSQRSIEFSYISDNDKWLLSVLQKKTFNLSALLPFSPILRSRNFISYFDLKLLKNH